MFTDDVDYVPVGCYKDKISDRALPELLENYRVETTKYPDVLKWNDLEYSVIERCAAKVCLVVCFICYVGAGHNELLQTLIVSSSQKVILLRVSFSRKLTRIQSISVVIGEYDIFSYALKINLYP